MHYLISLLLSITLLFSISPLTSAFSGNFELSDIVVSSPCQVDPKSTASTYIELNMYDQDTPEVGSTHCCVEWAVDQQPPTTWTNTCDNSTFGVLVQSWNGVDNMSLQMSHQYIDNSVGQYPYNVLTKFSEFRLAYPSTQYYDCDMSKAECQSSAVIVALVTEAVA